ncbi:hypothetical protein NDK25_24300 [Niallia taxi]|nr:hypothetical protein [Niallia taxi]MDE5055343.1 hypothetical protein [Niallia taxi]
MFNKTQQHTVLSIDHYYPEDSSEHSIRLYVKVNIINQDFLDFIYEKRKVYICGDFIVKLKEKTKSIKVKRYPYNSGFEKIFYTTRTFSELLEGTSIEFKSTKNAEKFLGKLETKLTSYLYKDFSEFTKMGESFLNKLKSEKELHELIGKDVLIKGDAQPKKIVRRLIRQIIRKDKNVGLLDFSQIYADYVVWNQGNSFHFNQEIKVKTQLTRVHFSKDMEHPQDDYNLKFLRNFIKQIDCLVVDEAHLLLGIEDSERFLGFNSFQSLKEINPDLQFIFIFGEHFKINPVIIAYILENFDSLVNDSKHYGVSIKHRERKNECL